MTSEKFSYEDVQKTNVQTGMFQLHTVKPGINTVIRVICLVPPFIQKMLQNNPQERHGPKYMPRLTVPDIRISFLFKENALFCPGTITALLYSMSSSLNRDYQSFPICFHLSSGVF